MSRRAHGPLPPGPRAPASVNTARLIQRPLQSLLGWRERYGDVFTVPLLVFGVGVYVSDPSAIREMLTGEQSDLHAGEANAPLSAVLGERSVLTLDGREHLRQRKLLLPPFQGSAIQNFRTVIRDVAAADIGSWREGERFVMRERMRALTFEVIVRAVFGVTDTDRIRRLRSTLVAVLDMQAVLFLPDMLRRDLGRFSPWGQFQRRLRAADELIYEEIALRRSAADLEDRTDVLSLLLRARDEDDRSMADLELRDELMTMLLAGHETTATGLAFAFDLLLRNPRVLRRLRAELIAGDDTYLDAVVTETLRLRPVIDANARTLTKPRTIGGWDLPAGIRVYPAIAVVHLREDLYPQPHEFRPERFIDGEAESYAWLPFGGGIRRCIGASLAQAEMAEVIRAVVSSVDLEPTRPDPESVVMRGITLVPQHGTPVVVRRIEGKPRTVAGEYPNRRPLGEIVKGYDRVAGLYSTLEPLFLIFPPARRKAVAALNLKAGDTVLEIGAGTGRNLPYLVDAVGPSGTVIAVDAAEGMLAEARKLTERHGWSNVQLIRQDAAQLQLDGNVDAVLFSLSYSVIPEPGPALARAWKLLCPSSRLVVMDMGLTDPRHRRALGLIARLLEKLAPGDPYSRPWDDLAIYGPVATEYFLLGLYYLCTVEKTAKQ
ncbi:MAG TPA: cytochrome P450 [Solirubrobacteraceae bacterium]|jgi:cytochrome P450/SAM-dependent methyltransferase|nr:cytochrome P450 [Solirubrobacteraceae bacterium]